MSALGDLIRQLAYADASDEPEIKRQLAILWFDSLSAIDRLGYIGEHGGPPEGWEEYRADEEAACQDRTTSAKAPRDSDVESVPTGSSTKLM